MNMDAKRNLAIEYLRSLADEDLAQLFYEAVEPRNDRRSHDDGDFWNDVFVVGIATHIFESDAETYVLAPALNPKEPGLQDVKHLGALQSGRCDICKTVVRCTSKLAKCPVCATVVECT